MPARTPLTNEQIYQVNQAIRSWSLRDRCLLQLGFSTGLRATEIGSLTVGQVFDGAKIRDELTVSRCQLKGGRGLRRRAVRSRTVPLGKATTDLLASFLAERQTQQGGVLQPQEALFRSSQGPGGLRRWMINVIVKRACAAAGLPAKFWGSHSMRKSFCRRLYEASGKDINVTRLGMGHTSISVTQNYLNVDAGEVRSAILRSQCA